MIEILKNQHLNYISKKGYCGEKASDVSMKTQFKVLCDNQININYISYRFKII